MTTNRVRAGVPSGGQFSPLVRAEGLVALEAHGAQLRGEGSPSLDPETPEGRQARRRAGCAGSARQPHGWVTGSSRWGKPYEECKTCGVTRTEQDRLVKRGEEYS
ncbi:MAG: hypothetical protein WKF57_06230 [Nakamurella sp.]